MSRALKSRKPNRKPAVARKRTQPPQREHLLEMESRLRIEEAEARCQRLLKITSIMVINAVVLIASAVWAVSFLGNYPPSDKQYMNMFIIQIVLNLLLYLAGKKFKWPF